MDVDGVLTDGSFYWSDSGVETKRFSFEDVMGISRAKRAGLQFGLISGEESILVGRFAEKCGITQVCTGCKKKGEELVRMVKSMGVDLADTAFIGDDVNDLPALAIAGFSVAPSNAVAEVKSAVTLVLDRSGGSGAVRSLIELILSAK